jgi:hypothetical protein
MKFSQKLNAIKFSLVICHVSMELQSNTSTGSLIMDKETVFRTLDCSSILILLIAQEDFIALVNLSQGHFLETIFNLVMGSKGQCCLVLLVFDCLHSRDTKYLLVTVHQFLRPAM